MKDTVAIFVAFVILYLMAMFVDVPLERLADPTDLTYIPRPDWYFLFLFQTLKFFKGSLEPVGSILLPTLGVLALIPRAICRSGKAARRSPSGPPPWAWCARRHQLGSANVRRHQNHAAVGGGTSHRRNLRHPRPRA